MFIFLITIHTTYKILTFPNPLRKIKVNSMKVSQFHPFFLLHFHLLLSIYERIYSLINEEKKVEKTHTRSNNKFLFLLFVYAFQEKRDDEKLTKRNFFNIRKRRLYNVIKHSFPLLFPYLKFYFFFII